MSALGKPRFYWFAVAGGVWVLLIYLLGTLTLLRQHSIAARPPVAFGYRNGTWFIAGVDPSGSAAGKRERGDRLRLIDGDGGGRKIGPQPYLHHIALGADVELGILRQGTEQRVHLAVAPIPASTVYPLVGTFTLVSVAFLLMAMLMGL